MSSSSFVVVSPLCGSVTLIVVEALYWSSRLDGTLAPLQKQQTLPGLRNTLQYIVEHPTDHTIQRLRKNVTTTALRSVPENIPGLFSNIYI